MSKPININLSPNTEHDDTALAWRLLFTPSKLIKGQAVEKLEEKFKSLLGIQSAVAFRSGRSALYVALCALDLKPGDEVLLQSFTCVAVPNAIIWSGAAPIYVDINDDFNISGSDIEKKISPRCRAIIVQHTFGLSVDMDKIMELAKKHNLFVIEDCAHALGAEYRDQKLGTFGDISIFSFGRDKVISSVFGGMLVTKDHALENRIKALRDNSNPPRKTWVIRQLFHPILMNWLILPGYQITIGKIILETLKRIGFISKAVYAVEKDGRKKEDILGSMPNALAMLALNQLEKLDKFNSHRRKIAAIYDSELRVLQGGDFILPQSDVNTKHIYLRYVIKTSQARKLIGLARERNIILDDWYNPAVAPVGVKNEAISYWSQSCPNAERISALSLNLPTNINTSERDAKKIIEFLKNVLKS